MNNGNNMDELEKNIPDNVWRKAFEDAAETPPPRVWDAIERRLDESEGPKILPLWGSGLVSSRPSIWATGLAAAVALLLVGWWMMTPQSETRSLAEASQRQPSEKQPAPPKANSLPETATILPAPALNRPETVAANAKPMLKAGRVLGGSAHTAPLSESADEAVLTERTQSASRLSMPNGPLPGSVTSFMAPNSLTKLSRMAVASYSAAGSQLSANSIRSMPDISALFEPISGKPMRFRRLAAIQRIVWVRPVESLAEPAELKSKHKSRELWASVSMMPGSFNPSVSLRSTQSSVVNAAVASSAQSSNPSATVNSQANFSVAYQAGAGVQLTERWSVESGLGYLSGRSTVETPGQQAVASLQQDALANRNMATNNLYLDALRSSVQAKAAATNPLQASYNSVGANTAYRPQAVYDTRNQQVITNNYQYIQVPIQVGYQIRPRKRLSMAVLGGLLTNIFVRNTAGNEVVVSAKDGVYKPVSLAATMGARFRYRPSRRWSASLAGVYQPSLESGTEADSQVQSRPTSAGMSFGVDYHF